MTPLRFLLEKIHAHVHGNRIEAAAVDDPRAGFFGTRMVSVDHLADPLNFAGQVAIVGAGFDTGGDKRRPVKRIGAYGCDDNARSPRHFG